jgi:hypothetical protein
MMESTGKLWKNSMEIDCGVDRVRPVLGPRA